MGSSVDINGILDISILEQITDSIDSRVHCGSLVNNYCKYLQYNNIFITKSVRLDFLFAATFYF